MLLEILEEKADGITIVRLKGRLTLGREVQRLEDHVSQLKKDGVDRIIFEMSGVDFVDSAGLGMLTQSYSIFNNGGGKFVLTGITERVSQILKLTRLDTILPIVGSEEQAKAQVA
jgi:anti-sigma B factor antagonist